MRRRMGNIMTEAGSLSGKTAVVTGSVQGIGLAVAEVLARAGARIAVHGLASAEQGEEIRLRMLELGAGDSCYHDANLREHDAVKQMMQALEGWGPVDILVNNAGIQRTAPLPDVDLEIWDSILQTNLTGAYLTMRAVLPGMAQRGYGRVVNIASVHGLVASINKAPYVAAKHGLVGLTKVAALEYAALGQRAAGGVTVNCVCPGWTETEIIEPQIAERTKAVGDRDKAIGELLAEKQPTRRMSDPREIGEVVSWLCQPVAHNITGASIPVDGGWTAQ